MTLDKYERVWLTAVGGLIGSFMAALMVAYLIFDIRLPTFEARVDPANLNSTMFADLGVKKRGENKYDVVMLDPPAFTKSRSSIEKAVTGYKEINLRGMKMINNGGFLVTSSCTNLVSPELFLDTIYMAAKDAKKRIRQVTYQSQSSDHPIIWGMENTHYLKFLIVEVCDR